MTDNNYPPPANVCSIPDYILGKLMYYDEGSNDNCKWVVYDGNAKVRCPSRAEAIAYIQKQVLGRDGEAERLIIDARAHIQSALQKLDRAATRTATNSLLLARLSARLRPFVVDLDNIILNNYGKNT